MNFCTKCGLQIEEGLNFCTNCGEAIFAPDETSDAPNPAPNAPESISDVSEPTPNTPETIPEAPDETTGTHDSNLGTPFQAPEAYQQKAPLCKKCGAQVEERFSFCTVCGESTSVLDATPPVPTHTPQYQAPLQRNELVADSLSSIAKTFTANPEDRAETVVSAKSPAWTVIGALYVLIFALATHVLHYVIMRDFGLGDIAGQRFLNGLLIGILYFVGFACCVKLLFSIFKKNMSFLKAITIVAGCSIMVSVIMVAAIVMSFISIWVAQLLMTLSAVAFHIMVYSFIKSTSEFKNSPLWAYLGLMAALNILQHIIVNNVLD